MVKGFKRLKPSKKEKVSEFSQFYSFFLAKRNKTCFKFSIFGFTGLRKHTQTNLQNKHIMKKTSIALGVAAVAAASTLKAAMPLDDLSVTVDFGYESEYVFRAVKLDQQVIQPGVELELDGLYAGVWGSYGISSRERGGRETDFYAGYTFPLDEMIDLDFGATYYYYSGDDESTFEIYGGASFDFIGDPSAYIFYDLDLEVWTFELSGSYEVPLEQDFALELSGNLGYQRWTDDMAGGGAGEFNHYYLELYADLVFDLSDNASFSVGPRLTTQRIGSSDDGTAVRNAIAGGSSGRELFWWGAKFSAGF
ncbi:MAG: TorF family putative porin [Opitutales bacterium]|nr:TorF family putative porin [Opitutales bacterium]